MYKPYYRMYRKLRNMFNKKQTNMSKLNVFFLAVMVNTKRNIYSYNGNVL